MGHRCPGEAITQQQLTLALEVLTRWITYEVPAQDLGYPLNRMPTSPRSGFVLGNVRPGAMTGRSATRDAAAAMTF